MKKGAWFQKERFFIFLNRRWGFLTPNNPPFPRAYATAYMPLKETPIYLLLHSNRNNKNAVQATHRKSLSTATVTSQ